MWQRALTRGVALTVAFALSACAHKTTILVKQKGAAISVDGESLGEDEVVAELEQGMGGEHTVVVTHEKHGEMTLVVPREHVNQGNLWGGIGGCVGGGLLGSGSMLLGAGVSAIPALLLTALGIPCGAPIPVACACASPVVGVCTGVPFLALLLWLNQGPDTIEIDMATREVVSTPPTEIVVQGADSAGGGAGHKGDKGDDDDEVDEVDEGGARGGPVQPGKELLTVAANMQRGPESVGGKLRVTTTELIFSSHDFNVQKGDTRIAIADIRSTEKFGLIPNGLRVVTKSGQKYEFRVSDRDKIIALINQNK